MRLTPPPNIEKMIRQNKPFTTVLALIQLRLLAPSRLPGFAVQFILTLCAFALHAETALPPGTFRNHVQPILAKMGCSSGACHGAAAGQNGFKLSLRGYDNEGDYLALTRHALGRRIIPSDPGRSLMLLKPTGAVPHKGGKRFEVDSDEYR